MNLKYSCVQISLVIKKIHFLRKIDSLEHLNTFCEISSSATTYKNILIEYLKLGNTPACFYMGFHIIFVFDFTFILEKNNVLYDTFSPNIYFLKALQNSIKGFHG